MRTLTAAILFAFSAGAFAQSAPSRSINIDRPGQLEALERENPGHYLKILHIRDFASQMGSIDKYEFIVHPRLAGHGPTLFAGLSKPLDLKLVSRLELGSGAVAMRYEPVR